VPVPLKHRHGDYDKFVSEWSIVFAQADMIDESSDHGGADWESLCVGWAIAKGMTINQAFDFYQEMLDQEMG
jgi:hypothetical protein